MNQQQYQQIQLPLLNLPHFDPELKEEGGKLWIFDSLRRKYLVLTPEEWVRQHWINALIHHHAYPKGLFSLEKGLKYNQLTKRTDLVVFDRDGAPFLLVECKAPQVKIDQKTLHQAMLYNQTVNCPNLVLSNGHQHICITYSEKEKKYLQSGSIPPSP